MISFVIDKTPPRITKLPTENFVSLNISKSILYDDCETEDIDCEDRVVVEGSSASGMIFSELDTGESLILTAGHFCETVDTESPDAYYLSMVFQMETKVTVTDFYGTVWEAEIIDLDREKDLCLVKSDMPAFRKIRLADSMPEIGEHLSLLDQKERRLILKETFRVVILMECASSLFRQYLEAQVVLFLILSLRLLG